MDPKQLFAAGSLLSHPQHSLIKHSGFTYETCPDTRAHVNTKSLKCRGGAPRLSPVGGHFCVS